MKKFYIVWDESKKIIFNRESDSYSIPVINEEDLNDCRIYAIYGRHPVYGPNSLLYIGETKLSTNNKKRNIQKRIKEHLAGRFWSLTELEVRLGIVYQFGDEKEIPFSDDAEIQAIESLLISSNIPALNRKFIDGPNDMARNIHVVNFGFYGDLVPESSGLAFE